MSGVKHTPGPWTLGDRDGDYVLIDATSHTGLASVVWQMEDDRLCGDPSPEKEANARLIAAAPCMFEYILSSAQNGCATAQEIVTRATGDRPEKGGTL